MRVPGRYGLKLALPGSGGSLRLKSGLDVVRATVIKLTILAVYVDVGRPVLDMLLPSH